MYQVGDLIVYGNSGVCKIVNITTPEIHDINKEQLYYVLKPLYQECVIYTPVNNTKVFMRQIISAEEAEHLIDMIPTIQAEIYHNKNFTQLSEHYETYIKNYDCADLIELVMSIYDKRQLMVQQKRKLGQIDERFMKRAEELLYGELSAALNISIDKVPKYIEARVQTVIKKDDKN
ncbi:MAG: CarD family transcriptional regulator [Bacillota bacterium]|nr:CarD family transcriptional regulator [Bacillota bacterium]